MKIEKGCQCWYRVVSSIGEGVWYKGYFQEWYHHFPVSGVNQLTQNPIIIYGMVIDEATGICIMKHPSEVSFKKQTPSSS